ncbi:Qat anti-phage system associated protein QatB [Cupriavidus sp. amp6]|uniref:Qat anti-phage system associated protein QatB n=1 Tax=Cupriavidus sp. amp6 TaxID=388051 RepID=UPI0018DC18C2|nr:Qat anti-phage system associated protein QatB [Cupriavidus sp. amp6]
MTPQSPPVVPGQPTPATAPRQPDTGSGGDLSGARGNFTRFARTGSSSSLGKAVSQYVSKGTGGPRRAARRMGAAQGAARGLLGVVRDFQRLGPVEALRQLNLDGLAGQPATDVFVAILEFICPPGGTVDEGIARQAMLETISDFADAETGSFDSLTREQLQDFFLDFIARSIEGRVMADIGGRGVTLPEDVEAVQDTQDQLHDFIDGATRGQLQGRLANVDRLSDQAIADVVSQIYEAAFELIVAAGESAS